MGGQARRHQGKNPTTGKEAKSTSGLEQALRDLEHDKPEPPKIPRLMYADATLKHWPIVWRNNGQRVALSRRKPALLLGSHGMGKDSAMRNLGLLNQLWDGNSVTIDRRQEGASFTVRGARLTVALQVQRADLARVLPAVRRIGAWYGLSGAVSCGVARVDTREPIFYRCPGELAAPCRFPSAHCRHTGSTRPH